MNNNKIYHEFISNHNTKKHSTQVQLSKQAQTTKPTQLTKEVRFTKVLTKYSTEYNNAVFIQSLCQQLGMDKKDLFGFFMEMIHTNNFSQMNQLFENYEISKLDLNRMHRYLDKYTKENVDDVDVDLKEPDEILL
jgi:hypothetical protein